jgi:hypothetical protein
LKQIDHGSIWYQIEQGVPWAALFTSAIIILLYIALRKWGKLSIDDLLKILMGELRNLISLKPTPGAINALGIVTTFIVVIVYSYSRDFRETLSAVTSLGQHGVGDSEASVPPLSALLIACLTFVSVLSVRGRR